MPHQRPDSTKATSQNAAAGYQPASEQAREQHAAVRPEAHAYAAPDVKDSSLAPPAAGEVSDYMDEGDPSFGAHQGASNTNRELHASNQRDGGHGPKTRAANKRILKGKDAG